MTEKLKPCPFCGDGIATVASNKHELGDLLFFGMCMSCGAKGPSKENPNDAVSEWNRRAEVPKRFDGKPAGMSAEQFDACYEDDGDADAD